MRVAFGVNIPGLMSMLISPLAVAADSPFAVVTESLISRTLWFAGIHGGSIIAFNGGALYPFALANIDANAAAVAAGQAMPYIITPSFESFYQDSSVSAFAICLMMVVVCKSSHLKQIGKLAALPAVFGVKMCIRDSLKPVVFLHSWTSFSLLSLRCDLGFCFFPVSYTHLDVYKRQAQQSSRSALCLFLDRAGLDLCRLSRFVSGNDRDFTDSDPPD